MPLRNRLALSLALSALALLAACGNNGSGTANPVAPPTGAFSNSNLNGSYVFSISGTDNIAGAPYAAVGLFTANGSGGISGGAVDMNDAAFPSSSISPVANAAITGGSYKMGQDGRGQATLSVATPLGSSIVLDFVLQDSSHGLVTQFDGDATGSGTLDVQTAGVTPTGAYAFLLSGATVSGTTYAAAGNFTLSGNSLSGLADVNNGGIISYTDQPLSGSFAVGPSSTPSTTFSSSNLGGTFDVIAIDASHLKFIELDQTATLIGDAYSQTSTSMPAGTLAFTMLGCAPCSSSSYNPLGLGGFMVSDGNGNITNASTEDYNDGGTVSQSPSPTFTANYTSGGTGRFVLSNFAAFVGGSTYVAYPSSGGLLLMEIDGTGLTMGAAYAQQSGATFASSQGYGLNLTGLNTSGVTGTSIVEVDDIAEFTAASGGALSGVIDENFALGGAPNYALALSSGTYSAPDTNGRGQLSSAAGNSNNSTLEGGFNLNYYTVDGTTFPFIEMDQTQISVGVMVEQNASASSSAAAKAHMFVVPGMMAAHPMLKNIVKKWK
ncbi:MAG: hypothetical protein WAM79_13070 [Candidatus Sulfotelmatobacter sp.]